MSEKNLPPLPAGASFEPPKLPKGASLESPTERQQTLFTEETVYDPVTGLPLSSVAYGPEAKGATKFAQKALTTMAGAPINYAMATAKPVAGVAQIASQILGTNVGEQPLQALNQIESGVNQNAYSPITKTAGFVGDVANPLTFGIASKGMQLGQKIPALPSWDRLTNLYRAGAGGAIGGLGIGLTSPEQTGLTPEQFAEEKAKTLAINAGVGTLAPAVVKLGEAGFKGARSLVEPLYQSGQERILGRALREAAGGDVQKAITNMENAQNLVKGSMPTAAEVAQVPSLAATQRSVMATSPEAANAFAERQMQQNIARTQALRNITSPTRVSKYTDLRAQLGDDLYEPALSVAMDFSTLPKNLQSEVGSLVKTPAIKKAMSEAQENALNRGVNINDPAGSLRGLHETKMALDDQINLVVAKLERDGKTTSSELKGLRAAKDRLLNFIETVSPDYKAARVTFSRLSKPVEQLEAIEKASGRVINPATDAIYPQQFARTLESLKLEGKLSPQQIARLQAINDDLQRSVFAQNAGRGVGSDTVQKLAYSNMLNQFGVPNMLKNAQTGQIIGNLASRAGDVVYGRANKELTSKLAETLLSPSETARLMRIPEGGNLSERNKNLARMLMLQSVNQGE